MPLWGLGVLKQNISINSLNYLRSKLDIAKLAGFIHRLKISSSILNIIVHGFRFPVTFRMDLVEE